jgi:hypothetical protein
VKRNIVDQSKSSLTHLKPKYINVRPLNLSLDTTSNEAAGSNASPQHDNWINDRSSSLPKRINMERLSFLLTDSKILPK